MKITKRQLRRMIGEEVETLEYAIDARPGEDDVDDIEAEEGAWAGGANLVDPMDFEGITGMKVPPKGIEIMKITERQLRRIIREEKARLLNEQAEMGPKTANAVQLLQTAYINLEELAEGMPHDHVAEEILMNLELVKDAVHQLGGVMP